MKRPLPLSLFWYTCAGLVLLFSLGIGSISLSAQAAYRLERLPEDCCYRFGYEQLPPAGPITRLDLELTAAGARFSEIASDPAADWTYQISPDGRRLQWSWSAFSLPGAAPELFDFCITGAETESTGLAIAWRSNTTIVRHDTLELSCASCTELDSLQAYCSEAEELSFEFRYRNASPFRVDHLRILEPAGQDLILVDRIDLPAGVLPDALSDELSLPLRPEAEGLPEICFELVASRTLSSGESVACCYQRYCLAGPVCDRCCTAEADFIAEVEQGFDWWQNTDSCMPFDFTLRAAALGDCDFIQWKIRAAGSENSFGTTGTGTEAVSFSVADTGTVFVEMRVRRRDRSGKACYAESWRVFRDTIQCIVATESIPLFSIGLRPNPTTTELRLSVPFPGRWSVHCFDATGRRYPLPPILNAATEFHYSVIALPPGIYFLRIRAPTGGVLTRRFWKLN